MSRKFYVSPSTLNLFIACPRCFWFHLAKGEGFKRPEQPSSTLPRKMDFLIKNYFDKYRAQNLLPPEIAHLKGQLVEEALIKKWRFWQSGLRFSDVSGSELFGALDECLISDGAYIPVDYKTRGFQLKEDSTSYYVLQMSCYNFLLAKNGYPVRNYAYLVYYILTDLVEKGTATFYVEAVKIDTFSLEKVYGIFKDALNTLCSDAPPEQNKECAFCNWAAKVSYIDKTQFKLF